MLAFLKSRCRTWHRSTWVVVALTALVLMLANVPGQLEYTLDLFSAGPTTPPFHHKSRFAHGWPLGYLQRRTELSVPAGGMGMGGGVNLASCWLFWTEVTRFRPWYLLIDLLAAPICLLVAGLAFERWRSRRTRLWQLHLRDCFALMSVIGIAAGWLTYEKRRYDAEQRVLDAMHHVEHNGRDFDAVFSAELGMRGPTWLRELCGKYWPPIFDPVDRIAVDTPGLPYLRHFPHLESVEMVNDATNEQIRALESIPNLKALSLCGASIYSANMEVAKSEDYDSVRIPLVPSLRGLSMLGTRFRGNGPPQLPNLEILDLGATYADDAALKNLCNCPNLARLSLNFTQITDEGLVHLRGLNNLAQLDLGSTKITGAGLIHLRGLSQLRRLNLHGTQLADSDAAGLMHLCELTQLKELCLNHSILTTPAGDQLRQALPNCEIIPNYLWKVFKPEDDSP